MARTEIVDEEIGSASDDNSASEKHKKVFISQVLLTMYVYAYIVETACKKEFYENCQEDGK